jgi:glycosyltransferase involved in cell wall biosynthesis
VKSKSLQLTVITAVYNGEKYIESTVNSVLHFARNIDFEYIVVDDGSTDSTPKILESFGSRIQVLTQPNQGESTAVNVGIMKAKGKCCLVVSADDPILTEKLFEEVFQSFEEDDNLVAVYPDWQMIDPDGQVIKNIEVPDYSDDLLIGRCRTLPGPGVIFRTSSAQQIGGRKARWTFVGDFDFWLRLSRVGEIRHRTGILAQWRYHENSTSVNKRGLKMAQERIDVIEEFLSEFEISDQMRRKALGTSYYMASRLTFFSNEVPGRKLLLRAFQLRRSWIVGAQLRVIIYILFLPLSRLFDPILKRSSRLRTLI